MKVGGIGADVNPWRVGVAEQRNCALWNVKRRDRALRMMSLETRKEGGGMRIL